MILSFLIVNLLGGLQREPYIGMFGLRRPARAVRLGCC